MGPLISRRLHTNGGEAGQARFQGVTSACIFACISLILSGLAYRALSVPVEKIPLDPNTLAAFPLVIGEWVGGEIPLDPDLEDVIDADTYVSRHYSRDRNQDSINIYFPCGVDTAALLQHIPENCYVGAGWTLVDRHYMELPLPGDEPLPCNVVLFSREGIDRRQLVLLHFLVADGEYFPSFSSVAKAKGWRHFAGVRYAAQVQIVTAVGAEGVDAATRRITDFALAAIPAIRQIFQELELTSHRNEAE